MKTTVRLILTATLLLTLTLIAAGQSVAAQDDDDLIAPLAELIAELFERVEALESIYRGPGAPDRDNGRTCLIAESRDYRADSTLQNESLVKFVAKYNQAPAEHRLVSLRVEKETGHLLVLYAARHTEGWAYTFERWDGCNFEGSSPWRPAEG